MDANGHRFWLFAEAGDFDLPDPGVAWTDGCLRLAGAVPELDGGAARSLALEWADLPAMTVDEFGTSAWVDTQAGGDGEAALVMATGAGAEPISILAIPEGAEVHDLSADGTGVLRLVGALADGLSGLAIADLRGRWRDPVVIETPEATPDRVTSKWLLERTTGRLWAERGVAISDLAVRARADHIFRPDPEYANPPRLEEEPAIEMTSAERIADCAERTDGTLAVLVLSSAQARRARLVFVSPSGNRQSLDIPARGFPSSIAWASESRLMLVYPEQTRALALDVQGSPVGSLSIAAARYPLKGAGSRRLARGTASPAQIVAYENDRPTKVRPLHPISLQTYAANGQAIATHPIDAGRPGAVWHRVVVEGDFPPGTGATISITAADTTADLAEGTPAEHHVGMPSSAPGPHAAWIAEPSELPFHAGLLNMEPVPDRRGCFTVLVQRSGTAAREVAGRYAHLTVTLRGNGQGTPRIMAIRLYGDRFSLVRNYLPPIFHPPADPTLTATRGDAHPRDFAERHVAMFESVLTRLEDKIAAAPMLTDPAAAPAEALDWLSGWIGLTLSPGLGTAERRAMLTNAMRLHRRRGTLGGLLLALDLASGGEVSRGGIVAVEDFRLRRVFATILGAELGAEYDPLLGGSVESGNSYVGPTLHVGDADEVGADGQPRLSEAQETELAALYRAPENRAEADAVRSFFAQLAYRATVLVHKDMDEARFRLLADIAQQMSPAHVALRVERASQPLILGLYSLVGVDTYLRPRPAPGAVHMNKSVLGEKDVILRLPALDPRLEQGDIR